MLEVIFALTALFLLGSLDFILNTRRERAIKKQKELLGRLIRELPIPETLELKLLHVSPFGEHSFFGEYEALGPNYKLYIKVPHRHDLARASFNKVFEFPLDLKINRDQHLRLITEIQDRNNQVLYSKCFYD